MYDPESANVSPDEFHTGSERHNIGNVVYYLKDFQIFYIDRHTERDMRDAVHDWLTHRRETA